MWYWEELEGFTRPLRLVLVWFRYGRCGDRACLARTSVVCGTPIHAEVTFPVACAEWSCRYCRGRTHSKLWRRRYHLVTFTIQDTEGVGWTTERTFQPHDCWELVVLQAPSATLRNRCFQRAQRLVGTPFNGSRLWCAMLCPWWRCFWPRRRGMSCSQFVSHVIAPLRRGVLSEEEEEEEEEDTPRSLWHRLHLQE